MFNRLIAWSLHNRLIVLAITLILFVVGGYTLQRMPVDVFPEFAPPQVVIQTEVPGMAPQDVESLVTYPLESAINGTPGVASVRSKLPWVYPPLPSCSLPTPTCIWIGSWSMNASRMSAANSLWEQSHRSCYPSPPPWAGWSSTR